MKKVLHNAPAYLRRLTLALSVSLACYFLLTAKLLAEDQSFPELAAYWPLTNNSLNAAAADTNHGLVVGEAVFDDGALVLNGQDSFVSFGSALSVTGSLSVCLWLKPAEDDKLMRVLGKFEVLDNNREYCVFLNQGNKLWAFFSSDGSTDEGHAFLKTTLLPAMPKQEWRHLAITWDSSRGSAGLSFYIDGEIQASADVQAADIRSLRAGAADLTLGAYDLAADADEPVLSHAFEGSLCQLILLHGVLMKAEIMEVYQRGRRADLRPYLSAYLPEVDSDVHGTSVASSAGNLADSEGASAAKSGTLDDDGLTIYVDARSGDDSFNGAHGDVVDRANARGPKKTIMAAIRSASGRRQTVSVAAGCYNEFVQTGGVLLVTRGLVVIGAGN